MMTLSEALNRFLQVDRSPYTRQSYELILKRMVKKLGPDQALESFTYNQIADYFFDLTNHPLNGHPLKHRTIVEYLMVIRNFFSFCQRCGYLSRSPADELSIRELAEPPLRHNRAVPAAELRAMIDAAKFHKRNYAILLFFADTGCRVGGIASLTLEHLDLIHCTALLLEKGSQWKRVYFGEETAAALREWLAERPACDHNFVFTNTGGRGTKPLTRNGFSVIIQSLSKKIGASRVWRPHAIRHAVAHALVERGLPPSAVQRKLNHASPLVTMLMYFPQDDAYIQSISSEHALAALGAPPVAAPLDAPAPGNTPIDEPSSNIIHVDWREGA